MNDGVVRSPESTLTAETHGECGSALYRVGSKGELFCVSCSTKTVTDPSGGESG